MRQQIWGEVVDFILAFFQFIWECNSENIVKIGPYLPKLLQEKFGAVFFGPPCIWATHCSTILHNSNPDIWHLKLKTAVPATPAFGNVHRYLGNPTFFSELVKLPDPENHTVEPIITTLILHTGGLFYILMREIRLKPITTWSQDSIVPSAALLHLVLTGWSPVRFSEGHVTWFGPIAYTYFALSSA